MRKWQVMSSRKRSRKIRTKLEIYMVILNTASEGMLPSYKIASYTGLGYRSCISYLSSMEAQELITPHRDGNRTYWSTTPEGKQLAVDIEKLFERAGIELRK